MKRANCMCARVCFNCLKACVSHVVIFMVLMSVCQVKIKTKNSLEITKQEEVRMALSVTAKR